MKIRIDVTEKHIKRGLRRQCRRCPVALALREQMNVPVDVVGRTAYIGEHSYLSLPGKASSFIWAYDERRKVEPFFFHVDIPEQFLKRDI